MFDFDNITKVAKCNEQVDAVAFNVEIKIFLTEKQVSFDQLFLPENKEILEKLFQNDLIVSYLARSSANVKLNDTTPILESAYEKNLYLNFYESIKDLTFKQTVPLYLPVRVSPSVNENNAKEILSDELINSPLKGFYDQGINTFNTKFVLDKLHLMSKGTGVYVVTHPSITSDIYRVASFIYHLKYHATENPFANFGSDRNNLAERALLLEQNQQHKVNFVISANFKDNHATVIFTILDDNQKPILSSLMNSWINNDDSYHSYSQHRFDMTTTRSFDAHYPKIPFLETSYNLQTSSEDKNCVLYSLNNIEAMINLFEDQEMLDVLVMLAQFELYDAFQTVFLEGIERNSPQYFNCDAECIGKTPEELAHYHVREKWDIGSRFIQQYACANEFEVNEQQVVGVSE